MRGAAIVVVGWLIVGAAVRATPAERSAVVQRRDTVRVRLADARFVFPVERKARWAWHQPATRYAELEYAWIVEVGGFEFGQLLYKPDSSFSPTPRAGTLEALVWSGQFNLWRRTGQSARSVPGAVVNVTADGDSAVSVWIRDRITYDMIFDSRPTTAIMRWRTKVGEMDSLRVVLTYDR